MQTWKSPKTLVYHFQLNEVVLGVIASMLNFLVLFIVRNHRFAKQKIETSLTPKIESLVDSRSPHPTRKTA